MSHSEMTLRQAGRMVLEALDGPIAWDEFVRRVLEIKPSRSKNPKNVVMNALREDEGVLFVRPRPNLLVPLPAIMNGIRFRRQLIAEEVKNGMLLAFPTFWGYIPTRPLYDKQKFVSMLHFVDDAGRPLPYRMDALKIKTKSGESSSLLAVELSAWMERQGFAPGDSIIFIIEAWESERRVFRLTREPQSQTAQHLESIIQRNAEFADALYQQLEASRDDRLRLTVVIPQVHVIMEGPRDIPGHHWWRVVLADPRISASDYNIFYADDDDIMGKVYQEIFPLDPAPLPPRPSSLPSEQDKERIFRFKAYFKHRKTLWRIIEIRGDQTLEELDDMLRAAFSHDFDHLSGFWKLIPKQGIRRSRQVSVGTIYPSFYLGSPEESANEIPVFALHLQPGDRLLYVYDFGDWIEHILELEAITEPEADREYPRIAAQNKRRNKYCVACKARGKKTVAEWICLTCSEEQGKGVYLCEDCVYESHEDHFVEAIIY